VELYRLLYNLSHDIMVSGQGEPAEQEELEMISIVIGSVWTRSVKCCGVSAVVLQSSISHTLAP